MKNMEKIQQIKSGIEYVNKQLKVLYSIYYPQLIEEKRIEKEEEEKKKIEKEENAKEINDIEELDENEDNDTMLSSSSFSVYVPPVPMPSIALDILENDLYNLKYF